MLHNKFDGTVGFSIDGGIKDSTHIRRLATEHDSPMPAIDNAHHHLLTARALHEAQARTGTTSFPVLDWSALIAGTRVAAGLDAFDGAKVRSRSISRHRLALWKEPADERHTGFWPCPRNRVNDQSWRLACKGL
jgi:hypothetical protein